MNHDPKEVWERYAASWKVESAAEKRALYETCLSPNCVYTDPEVQAHGWDELVACMIGFHQQVPGGHFVSEQFMSHHGRSMAKWKMLNAEAVTIGEGISYGEYDDQNRLVAMTGFF
jgi:hypothetical protein